MPAFPYAAQFSATSHQNTPVLSPVSLIPFPSESTQPLTSPAATTPKMRTGVWSTRAFGTHDSVWVGAWPSSNTDAYVGGTAEEEVSSGEPSANRCWAQGLQLLPWHICSGNSHGTHKPLLIACLGSPLSRTPSFPLRHSVTWWSCD